MKLELKHLAYLPYKVNFYGNGKLYELDLYCASAFLSNSDYKLVLHPLSDLTKEIEVNGEKFIPFDKIAIYRDEYYLIEQIKTGLVEVIVWQMLLSWHFDVFGLIEDGLAIDINTLK